MLISCVQDSDVPFYKWRIQIQVLEGDAKESCGETNHLGVFPIFGFVVTLLCKLIHLEFCAFSGRESCLLFAFQLYHSEFISSLVGMEMFLLVKLKKIRFSTFRNKYDLWLSVNARGSNSKRL